MTCDEAKKISLGSILDKIGGIRMKQNSRELWYKSPFRKEVTASFKIDLVKNVWFDHGEGVGGNVLDLVMRYNQCNLKQALKFLASDSFSFHQPIFLEHISEEVKNYEIKAIKPLTNIKLFNYIHSRCIDVGLAKKYCIEVHYCLNGRLFYAIGFKNVLGGYELRSKYFKGCLVAKSYSWICNSRKKVVVLEGWTDFLSLLSLYPSIEKKLDFIVLNSVSNKDSIVGELDNYNVIYLCLDNDKSGELTTKSIIDVYPSKSKDIRGIFTGYKDINEFLSSNNI
ncbi:toprim domain-containing protein [Myroides sp. LJL119]